MISGAKMVSTDDLLTIEGSNVSTDVYDKPNYSDYDYDVYTTESYYIDRVGCIPVAMLGIVGNLVSLVVWNSQTTYNATIFLFKYLAVWDTAFLVSLIALMFTYEVDPLSKQAIALNTLSLLAKLESVHTTLLVAFSRWLAVYRPVHVHTGSLLTRRHVLVTCLVVFVWCLAISAVFLTLYLLPEIPDTWVDGWTGVHIVGLAVPVLPLIVFNLLLLLKIRTPFSPTLTSASDLQRSTSRTSNHHLTMAIVFMSAFSVVIYTIGETVAVVQWRGMDAVSTLQSSFGLLQVANSSINIILYLVFSRKFRSSFTKCFKCCVFRGRAVSTGGDDAQNNDKQDSSSKSGATQTAAL